MMPLPLAVTVLNRYDLLRKMLESLAAGSMVPRQILVLDNGGRWTKDTRSAGAMPLWNRITVRSVRPGQAIGLAASWNEALRWREMRGLNEVLIITNDDLVWGRSSYEALVAGVEYGKPDLATSGNVGGFVCFAGTPELVERVGYFDERFFPAYFEDEDYHYRMRLQGLHPRGVPGCTIDHLESGSVQGMPEAERDIFKGHFQKNAMLYRQKWGGMVGEEQYTEPAI
jgi:GT2 family glycosyltransferase